MSAIWPSAVATDANLYVAKNSLQTTLATAINSSDTSVILASATGFPAAGGVTIDNEVIFYTGVSGATLTGCTRGADGTTAASHSVGVPVGASIIAFHHNGLMAEIEAIESYLDTVLGKGTLVTATEFAYVHGVTSAIQTQMDLKAPKANPTFTGTVTVPTPFTVGAVSVTATGTEMNYLVGVSSAIQAQLDLKAPFASPTFTGTVTAPVVAVTNSSNQLVLGTTRTATINAPTPGTTSRVYTFPDLTGDYSVVATIGAQTIAGAKSLTSILNVTVDNSTNNDVTEVLSIGHNTSGTPANGIGVEMDFYAETSTTPDSRLSAIGSTWTDVTHATRTSNLYFQTRNSGTLANAMTISGIGSIYGNKSGADMAVLSTYNSVPLNSVGGLANSISIQNSKTLTVDCSSCKCFLIQMSNGDAALIMTSYISGTITITGSSGIVVASSTPSSGQLGIFKSASSHTISFKSGSALTSSAASMQLCFLGNAPSAATNWA